jgi:hypothetical protein
VEYAHEPVLLPLHRLCFGDVLYGLGEERLMHYLPMIFATLAVLIIYRNETRKPW